MLVFHDYDLIRCTCRSLCVAPTPSTASCTAAGGGTPKNVQHSSRSTPLYSNAKLKPFRVMTLTQLSGSEWLQSMVGAVKKFGKYCKKLIVT